MSLHIIYTYIYTAYYYMIYIYKLQNIQRKQIHTCMYAMCATSITLPGSEAKGSVGHTRRCFGRNTPPEDGAG